MAIFFDGISSAAHTVSLSYDEYFIYINSQKAEIDEIWPFSQLTIDSFNNSDEVSISFGNKFPNQRLHISLSENPEIYDRVHKSLSPIEKTYQGLKSKNAVGIVVMSLLTIGVTMWLYLQHVSPFIGEQAAVMIPLSVEKQIGESSFSQFTSFSDIDTAKSKLLNEFYQVCGYQSEYDVTLTCLDERMVNAFALPGGHIVVYDEIIEMTDCYTQLAALLAHELAHVNLRHSMKQLARSVSGYLVFSVLTGDIAGSSSVILEQAKNLNELSNSRKYENESDSEGLQYMMQSQIDPRGMVELFEKLLAYDSELLDSITRSEKFEYLEFLSTHPTVNNRLDDLNEKIKNSAFTIEESYELDSLWHLLHN